MKNIRMLVFIIFLTAIFGYIALPSTLPVHINFPFLKVNKDIPVPSLNVTVGNFHIARSFEPSLGLDLQGGAHIVFEADTSKLPQQDRDNAMESVKNTIERRVNLFGATEPVIQTAKVGDQRRVIVEIPGVTDVNQAIDIIGKTAQLSFWEEGNLPPELATQSAQAMFSKQTNLTGSDLRRATVTYDSRTGEPQVSLEFNDDGRKKFADITSQNIQKRLAIFLDNQVVTAPVVQQTITDGNAVITGQFTVDEAKQLALELNAGALPVPIHVIEQRNVGATLGAESIHKSITAAIIGLIIVMLFMAIYYGIAGILADAALIIYTIITLGLFELIPITLTLAGIAGFILSIGMAVDANILIFERMKEEMRWGKKRNSAIEAGFQRAWTSIRDSNISSLITSAILFYFGSGIIRGFALTLAIGIVVSLFSAIFVTRTFLRLVYESEDQKK